MNISAIENISAHHGVYDGMATSGSSNSFSDYLVEQAKSLNAQAIEADVLTAKVISGETENLHQVISAIEKTKTTFDLAVQVRNKLLEGYQEIMRMQV